MDTERTPRPTEDLLRAAATLSTKQREVLAAVRSFDGGALIDDLSSALAMHPNTVRGHLDALLAEGVIAVMTVPGTGRGRPRHKYVVRVPRRSSVTSEYVSLVEVLTQSLPEGDIDAAREIGRNWARATGAVPGEQELGAHLRDMGFAPYEREAPGEIGLTACPFVTEAGQRPTPLICAMHEGFLREVTGSEEVDVMPFDRPGECGARVPSSPERRTRA
ncbi:helix-turn-helix transcriptional regulator [Corynebacterium sp. LK2510]|uniref:helix-turn-helix transcriptional regulator n=1 Tax=Corynebacterium sp. LK2510 TaxID=3110472 RepID=UPI0034CDDFF9